MSASSPRARHGRRAVVLAVAALALLVATAARAQPPDARDALIGELMRRLELLERRMSVVQDAMQNLGGAGPAVVRPAALPAAEPLPGNGSGTPSPPPAGKPPSGTPPAGKPTPGLLVIDEEAAERALERTLVQVGALLLPLGKAEVQPSFNFVRREARGSTLGVLGDGSVVVNGETDVRRNEFEPALALRVGLPWDAQLELALPYIVVDETTVRTTAGQRSKSARQGHGIGDLEVGLAKTVLREGRLRPDVIARVAWGTRSGQRTNNKVALTSSVDELRGSLTASKQQDPLAFFASLSYTRPFTDDHIRPGDRLGFGLGAALAASPETALNVAFNQSFSDDVRVRGQVIDGSDATEASLSFGISSALSRNVLLSLTAGVGLTEDSPDYFVGVSLPVRFDVPLP
jgi:hypothetical protein